MRGLSGCLSRTLLKKANPLVEKNKSLEAEKSIMTNEVMDLKENYKHVTQVIAELKETIVVQPYLCFSIFYETSMEHPKMSATHWNIFQGSDLLFITESNFPLAC